MNKMIDYYNQFDEWGRLEREPLEFIINWHHIKSMLPQSGHILDNGAGPGKYAMELAKHSYDVTLTDLTPRLVQLAREKAAELGLMERYRGFHTANATNLSLFPSEHFDASLMLGPLYHLQQLEERNLAAKELYRVTRRGGYVFVAFMSRTRHLLTSLAYPQSWKPTDNMEAIRAFLDSGIFNHSDEGRFTGVYYYNIEDIKPFMEAHGFDTVKLIGSSSIAGGLGGEQLDYWRSRGEKEYTNFVQLVCESAEDVHLLGASSHLLYIGVKK